MTTAKVQQQAVEVLSKALLAKCKEQEKQITELVSKLATTQAERARLVLLLDKYAVEAHQSALNRDIYALDCPLCKAAYSELKQLHRDAGRREATIFEVEHPRCQDCTILLGPGHPTREVSPDLLCESCRHYRSIKTSVEVEGTLGADLALGQYEAAARRLEEEARA